MAISKITIRSVEALQPGETIWDSEVSGFGVRCQRRDRIYVLKKRINGNQRTITIGKHGSPWSPTEARNKAREYLGDIAKGVDIHAIREGKKQRLTVNELAERYMLEYAEPNKKQSSVKTDRSNLENHVLPFFGDFLVNDVSVEDINRFLLNLSKGKVAKPIISNPKGGAEVKGGEGVANRCRALLSKMFNLAEQWRIVPQHSNPVKHAIKFQENANERFLTDEETANLGEALDQFAENGTYSIHLLNAIRVLMLTGARLGEVQYMKWQYIDQVRRCAFLPDSKTGRKPLSLSDAALAIINKTPRVDGNEFVFAGSKEGAPIVNYRKPWAKIREVAGLTDLRLHDLRHNFASAAINAGTSLPVVGGLLGHKNPKTTQRYAHLADNVVHAAGNRTADAIASRMTLTTTPSEAS